MPGFTIEESPTISGAKIKAIGVGGGGGNMINHMLSQGIEGIDLIVANTDAQALETSNAAFKIQLGEKLTRGLGAGMKPEIGQEAAQESYEAIKEVLDGADIVFVSSGLGGGTGTGAAPIIAQAAKEVGALTVSVVTKPFRFEGRKRMRLAEQGLEALKKESDSIIVIPNEKLLSIVDKNLGIKESFKMVDNILARAVSGISNVILSRGEHDINLDFADVRTVMSHQGLALMGVGEATGPSAAYEAIRDAIESPLLDNMDIKGAMGVLVHFHIHPDYPIMEISEAMGIVEDYADEDAHVIFGTTTDESVPVDEVKITIVATGFESGNQEKSETKSAGKKQTISLIQPEKEEEEPVSPHRIKVVGSDFENDDILDIPTWMRNQMD
ncbi:cell division protein FtsZ [Hydrogenimonas sp.]